MTLKTQTQTDNERLLERAHNAWRLSRFAAVALTVGLVLGGCGGGEPDADHDVFAAGYSTVTLNALTQKALLARKPLPVRVNHRGMWFSVSLLASGRYRVNSTNREYTFATLDAAKKHIVETTNR